MDERWSLDLLKRITEAPGVPGDEGAVQKLLHQEFSALGPVKTDRLGSIYAEIHGKPSGPVILAAGHMDEIGFMVRSITKEGFLRFTPLGGWWDQVLLGQRVEVRTRKGSILGVIGSKPPHILDPEERKKVVEKSSMFIDVGARDQNEATEEFGVQPGDSVVPISPFTPMANPKLLMGKAWDNRVGCALALEVARELAGSEHPNVFVPAGTVQEEVGLRGAQTLGQTVKPDIAFAFEVAIAGDMPGVDKEKAQSEMGKGPVILLYDRSMIPSRRLRDLVIDVAKTKGIPHQFDLMDGGGTDAGRFHLVDAGVPSLVIGVPSRYIHSHNSLIHFDDYLATVQLLTEVVKVLDDKTVREIQRVF